MHLSLNGFAIELSAPQFTAHVLPFADPSGLREFRKQHESDWFLHWREGTLYAIPRVASPATSIGNARLLDWTEHQNLQVVTARLNDVLPSAFPKYEALHRRPFAFLGQKDELVEAVTSEWTNVPALVASFSIRPRYELEAKIIELRQGDTQPALFMNIRMQWETVADIDQLVAAGVNVAGLYVAKREAEPGERRLVGRIQRVSDGLVHLSESIDGLASIQTGEVYLEPSRATFSRCLGSLLGRRFEQFEAQREEREHRFLSGAALDRLLSTMQNVLTKASPVQLAPDLSCSIGERLQLENIDGYQSVVRLAPVEYCYDAAKAKRDLYAWRGLQKFGAYSQDTFSKRTPKILVVVPDRAAGQVSQFVKLFRDGIDSIGNSSYSSGFSRTFGLVNPQFVTCTVPLSQRTNETTADRYARALEEHLARDADYQAALAVILDEEARIADQQNPYLRSKAVLLMNGIPVQEARLSTLTKQPATLQYTMQNIAVAVYAKMGGVPWTVAHDLGVDDELVIGMGMAELSGSRFRDRQRHMGITTVFRGDGNYLLANVAKACTYAEYPEVLRNATAEVLRDVKVRNGWRAGDTVRVVFHLSKPLKHIEMAEIVGDAVSEVGREQTVQFAFLTVSHEHGFKMLDSDQPGVAVHNGRKGKFVPDRGTTAQVGQVTRLLATNGVQQIKRLTTPLPAPLLVHLHQQSSYRDLAYLTEQVLKFTSLTWRSTQPAYTPVTIYYSELIAQLLGRLQNVPGWSPAVLNSKLRTSRWFL
jgi:Piwi domain